VRSFYDFDDYLRLVEAAKVLDPRIELLVLLAGAAGLRRGEAIALEWTDVDLRRETMHVQRSEWDGHVTAPKGGRSRRLPLTDQLAAALKAHRHLQGPRVLSHEDGSGIGRKAVFEWMQKAQRRAGLPATGAHHILRHTFCSHLAMQGGHAQGRPGARRAPGPHDDAALHAPLAGPQGRRHPAPRPATDGRIRWRPFGDGPPRSKEREGDRVVAEWGARDSNPEPTA